MYHMLPYSYRPEVRASRAQHGAFQNKITELVNKVLNETEVVDTDNPTGSKLFNLMDTFFSYGLLTADRSYWRCMRQFMPRAEQNMFIAEFGNANDRYLSIGWLKTAFNKGTLHFQMLALNNHDNKQYLVRFYHENSCVRNSGLLESVTELVEKLQNVQFGFYSTRQLRPEPTQAVVIDNAEVQISSRAAARQRKLTETEASSDTVLNIVPTVPDGFSASIDPDVLLDELVKNRRNRLNSEQINAQKALLEAESTQEPIVEPIIEEKLEDVMVKTMSAINMDLSASKPLEEILAQETEVSEHFYELSEGEFQMQQGDILHLAINTFEKSSERVIQTFTVFENFHSDSKLLRYLVMTNYNLYIMYYDENAVSVATELSQSPPPGHFKPILRLPHDRIETVNMGLNSLSVFLGSTSAGFIRYENDEEVDDGKANAYYASICSFEAGSHLMNSIRNVTDHTSRNTRPIIEFDDHFTYICQLQPNLEKQLKKSADVRTATLCYWYEHTYDKNQSPDSITGYLYKRNVNVMSNWLLKNQAEAEQKYCAISGTKMYVFVDSTCKEGEIVIDLSECEYTAEGRNSFLLKCTQGTFEFESANKEEAAQWGAVVMNVIDNSGTPLYVTPCLMALTPNSIAVVQEGEKFWYDGFLRLLNDFHVGSIVRCVLVFPDQDFIFGNQHPTICIFTSDVQIQLFFVRFRSEVERIGSRIHGNYGIVPEIFDVQFAKTPIGQSILNKLGAVKNIWPTPPG